MYTFARFTFTPIPSFSVAASNLAGISQVLIFQQDYDMAKYDLAVRFLEIAGTALFVGDEYTMPTDAIATAFVDGDMTEGVEVEVEMTEWAFVNDEYHWVKAVPCGSVMWESISQAEQDAIIARMPKS